MKIALKFLTLAAVLLATGASNQLSAQLTFPRTVRTYAGTVTETSAAGVVSTGTFSLRLEEKGVMYATTIINGTNNTYGGVVSRNSLGEKRTNGSGFVQFLPAPISIVPSLTGVTVVTNVRDATLLPAGTLVTGTAGVFNYSPYPKIPVVITPSSTYGGMLNEDGSSMVFRGERVIPMTED